MKGEWVAKRKHFNTSGFGLFAPFQEVEIWIKQDSANKGLPLPLGRGVCKTKSKNGCSRPRTPFISRVFCAQRGIEAMVSDHGPDHGEGVDPETVTRTDLNSASQQLVAWTSSEISSRLATETPLITILTTSMSDKGT